MAKRKTEDVQAEEAAPTIRGIKGFDANFRCRGFQFEVGKTYEVSGSIEVCKNGFHAIPDDQHPLSVFEFYPPAGSRYAEVIQFGETSQEGAKLASASISIDSEISLADLTNRAVKWVVERAKAANGPVAIGDNEAATASGYRGAATASGDQGAATASGNQGAATASGNQGAATASGDRGAATASGYLGAATASGDQGAATASGDQGAATASGNRGAATASGDWGTATASGELSCAMATGPGGKVRGEIDGVDLFAREIVWTGTKYVRQSIACGTTGVNGIKAGAWYRCEGGRLVEAES